MQTLSGDTDGASAIERVACNLCGAEDAQELYRLQDCRFFVDDVEWPVVRCRGCGLDYVNPRPTRDAIWKYYPAEYYQGRDDSEFKQRYELQAEQLKSIPAGHLLDLGCANGDWIHLMATRGWDVAGLEPSPNSENPHSLDVRRGHMPDGATWPHGTFDVVTAWAVVEHLHDPWVAFETAKRMLRIGGWFFVLVPNGRSLASRFAFQEDVPRHLHMFSEATLKGYAERSGFELEEVVHDPRFFGGGGRGALRAQLFVALGRSGRDYSRFDRLPLRQRFLQQPVLTSLTVPLALIEKVVLTDSLVRRQRLSGHVIARMRKL